MSDGMRAQGSERSQLIRSLRATLAKMEIALGELDDPIVFVDPQGRVEWCNQPFCELVERRKIETLGARVDSIVTLRRKGEPVPSESHPSVRLTTGEERSLRQVYELTRPDHSPLTVEVTGRHVQIPGGDRNAILLIKDITEREQSLRRDRLASLGALTSGMIHQINSPLAFARSNIEFLRSVMKSGKFDPDELDVVLDETLDGLDRISLLFSSVSAFSDETGSGRPFDLAETIETAAKLTRGHWDTVASMQIPPARGNTIVWGDASGISQALVQIIANAAWAVNRRQSREGAGFVGNITISLKPLDGWCELVVKDNGIGIAEGDHGRIFEPFFTTRRSTDAIGQGLFVARTIIEDLHGGMILSEPVAEGAHIVVRLPAYRRE